MTPCAVALAAGRDDWLSDDPADQERAKRECAGCPVIVRCLREALEQQDWWTVRGGTTGAERRRLPRARVRQRVRGRASCGTNAAYIAGCHCQRCRSAHARYVSGWRRRRVTFRGNVVLVFAELDRKTGTGRRAAYAGQLVLEVAS